MEFKEKLKQLRISKNMTQDDLAEKLYITRQSISKWEQGLSEPNLKTIKEICLIFDVSISELVDDAKTIVTTKEERQVKRENKLFLANGAFLIFGILLTAIFIRMMPKSIPVHWDINGNITRYGSKWETLIFMSLFALFFGISLFIHFYYAKNKREFLSGLAATQLMLLVFQTLLIIGYTWMAFSNVDEQHLIILAIVGMLLSLFMVLSIFSFPIFNPKRNVVFGFRTHFTLSNDKAWYKVNAFQSISGLIFSSIGLLIVLITFKEWNVYLLSLIIASLIPSFIYHEILRKRMKKEYR